MANTTVSQLAKIIKRNEGDLLGIIKAAGLKHKTGNDTVTDDEKKILLTYLQKNANASAKPKTLSLGKKVDAPATTKKSGPNIAVLKKKAEPAPAASLIPKPVPSAPRSEMDEVFTVAEKKREASVRSKNEELERIAREKHEQEQRKLAEQKAKNEASRIAAEAEATATAKKQAENEKKVTAAETAVPKATKPSIDEEITAKRKASKGKVKTERDDKDWHKHSHRPQDFLLTDEDLNEEQQVNENRRRQLAAMSKENVHQFQRPAKNIKKVVAIKEGITVGDLAKEMSVKSPVLIKKLMAMGEMVTINQTLDTETATLLVEELGHQVEVAEDTSVEDELLALLSEASANSNVNSRPPVVTVMGHVDHGKTSLLDCIRNAKVADKETGGITQHIGAYQAQTSTGLITFLDTPGHAAFTAMRARGAQATDIVILVVAADDGVMPQTKEAVEHSRSANVPMVVAINKIDKEGADPDRVKNELAQLGVIPEDWGGDIQFIPVSAHTGEGIDVLLEAINLQAELLELTAPVDTPAQGVVIESRLEKGRGSVCSLLIQQGQLKIGQMVLAGQAYGKVRAMVNHLGENLKVAGPSVPVELLGLNDVPDAGDAFMVVANERKAKEAASFRTQQQQAEKLQRQRSTNLETMFSAFDKQETKILSVFIKSDVRGSTEAIISALTELNSDEVAVNIIGSGVGGISESDINLAITTNAIVIGFNVRAEANARKLSEREGVEIRYYNIIYQLIDEVKQALSGMLAPEIREEIVGIADVRDTFRSPRFGLIAGCMVVEGTVYRNKPIRVLRDNVVIFEGSLESLRRIKDDVNEVRNGLECGIGVKDYDVQVGDQIEVYDVQEVKRQL